MNELATQHAANKATLEHIEATLSPSPPPPPPPAAVPNPLLSRGKLKPAKKSKPTKPKKKAADAAEVERIKADELGVVSAGIGYSDHGVADGEEGEVLDLADRLLEQLHAQEQAESASSASVASGSAPSATLVPSEAAPPPSKASSTPRDTLHDLKEDMLGMLHIGGHGSGNGNGEKKVSRQQARKLRKVQQVDDAKSAAQAEVDAANDTSIADERKSIDEGCKRLGVWVKEIEPDGHCLYSAIADQVNILQLTLNDRKETYSSVRSYAAQYMRAHPDDFLPFLETPEDRLMTPAEYENYCHTVEKTGEWGGQPEIIALSKYFRAPIHVLLAGTDVVKTGEDLPPGRGPILLSYHRKMYGLGEIAKAVSTASGVFYPLSPQYTSDTEHYMSSSQQDPACVFEAGNVQDVSEAIKIIGQARTAFAVMGGGHGSNPGWSSVGANGVHISFARMKEITLSADKKTSSEAVASAGEIRETAESTGFSALMKMCRVANTYGLTIDTVVSFQLVLPNGTITTVDSTTPDLFFGLKGAGNKLGIVTQFVLETYPQGPVNGGITAYGPDQLAALAAATTVFQETNQDKNAQIITTFNGIALVNGAILIQFYNGATPPPGTFSAFDSVTPLLGISAVKTQSFASFIEGTPSNLSSGSRGSFHTVSVTKLSKPLMDQVLNQSTFYNSIPHVRSATFLSWDVEPFLVDTYFDTATDSAFPHSSSDPWIPLNIYFAWQLESDDEYFHQALLDSAAALEATAKANGDDTEGKPLYPNYAIGSTPVERLFGANLPKLQEIVQEYDPTNIMGLAGGFQL
ncbi:hypothetical protein RQP46_006465 [Phenoliferia psychrophenolica]